METEKSYELEALVYLAKDLRETVGEQRCRTHNYPHAEWLQYGYQYDKAYKERARRTILKIKDILHDIQKAEDLY